MWLGKKRGYILLLVFLLALPIVYSIGSDKIPTGTGGDYRVIVLSQAQAGNWYAPNGFNNYRMRSVLGQRFIGHGDDDINSDSEICLGYMCMLNTKPVINNTAINANKTLTKHPYTNDTLACEINVTDKDIGDKLRLSVTWYKNSTPWYIDNDINANHRDIDYNNIQNLIDTYNIQFEPWHGDDEHINHTIIGTDFYSTNTTPHNLTSYIYDSRNGDGSLDTDDTKHYDIWKCSVDVYDGVTHSGWFNTTPMFIFNHRPDYNENMPTYYVWPEDTTYQIDLGSNFSDIDGDDINWYINWTSSQGPNRFTIWNISVDINNVTGIVTLTPNANVTGVMDIIFTGVDNNMSHSPEWYLWNDYGQTSTNVFRFNVSQVNDAPWPTNVYISSPDSGYKDTLSCLYNYNDIESNPENTSATSYIWWQQNEGSGPWINLGVNMSTLSSDYFDLDDKIICSVKIKDIYYDWNNVDRSLWSVPLYTNSTAILVSQEPQKPTGKGQIVIGVG